MARMSAQQLEGCGFKQRPSRNKDPKKGTHCPLVWWLIMRIAQWCSFQCNSRHVAYSYLKWSYGPPYTSVVWEEFWHWRFLDWGHKWEKFLYWWKILQLYGLQLSFIRKCYGYMSRIKYIILISKNDEWLSLQLLPTLKTRSWCIYYTISTMCYKNYTCQIDVVLVG